MRSPCSRLGPASSEKHIHSLRWLKISRHFMNSKGQQCAHKSTPLCTILGYSIPVHNCTPNSNINFNIVILLYKNEAGNLNQGVLEIRYRWATSCYSYISSLLSVFLQQREVLTYWRPTQCHAKIHAARNI